jgi:ribosomal protein S18 acetylase RimI-like enzyme
MGKPRYTIMLQNKPNPDDEKFVWDSLAAYNRLHAEDDNYQKLAVFLRDNQNNIVGGLLGETFWGWLHIGILWIREDLRGKGYGRDMLASAEKEAIKRGAYAVFLDTMEWQALEFYQKHGYTIYGQLDDFPIGHTRYYLKKMLKLNES